MGRTPYGVPRGATLAQAYVPGAAPARAAMNAPAGATLVEGPRDRAPTVDMDGNFCSWVNTAESGELSQCKARPVKKDNPERYCAGHLAHLRKNDSDHPAGDA